MNEYARRRGVVARMLIGGMLVALSLPILALLIVGALITGTIQGVHLSARRLRSGGHGDD